MSESSGTLRSLNLLTPVRATQRGLKINIAQLFSILELYNADTCTFFTPEGELGMALHEMHEVSGLPMGEVPYEEFIPGSVELRRLQSDHPQVYETFWELMCHFHICLRLVNEKTKKAPAYVSHKMWADYLFNNLDKKGVPVTVLGICDQATIARRIFDCPPHYTLLTPTRTISRPGILLKVSITRQETPFLRKRCLLAT